MADKSKNKQTSTSTSTLDPFTQSLQRDNFARAQAKFGNASYSPLTGAQIQAQMNPYDDQVVATTQADLERQRQMAVNATGDAAQAAGAFGGSRHGVAEGATNEAAQRTAAGILAQLRQQGFSQAQEVAQEENTAANNYPLLLQQLLNGTLSTVQGNTTTTGTGTSTSSSFSPLKMIGQGAQVAAMFSDLRLKTDVETTHHDSKGRRWVNFKYVGDDTVHHGVIAQEVRKTDPHAVIEHESGYLMVDYGALH